MRAGLVFKKLNIVTFIMMALLMSSNSVLAQLDDPTRPPGFRLVLPGGKTAAGKRQYFLTAVRISKIRRLAIVNDRTVETGDMVNGARVIAIYPASVKLKKQGKTFTVRLLSQVVKKIRAN